MSHCGPWASGTVLVVINKDKAQTAQADLFAYGISRISHDMAHYDRRNFDNLDNSV